MMTKGGVGGTEEDGRFFGLFMGLFHILGETIGGERLHIATLCLMEVA